MVTPAPLTTLPITSTNKNLKTFNIFKRKSEENISLAIAKKSTEKNMSNPEQTKLDLEKNLMQTKSTFRIPKITRQNSSPDTSQSSPSPINDNTSSSLTQVSDTKNNSSPSYQLNDESNSQQGKRKFSLSQYKEHKRSKSNDLASNYSGDVDMRITPTETIKNSPPSTTTTTTNDDDSNQLTVSPKTIDNSKDLVLKSNLSEPGVKKINKKKVVWADEKNQALVHTSIFEIDDSEKADMHAFARQCAANISLAQIEKLMERDLRKRQGVKEISTSDNDDRLNLPVLPRLIRILLPETIVIPTIKSQERFAQEEREKTVLQAFSLPSFLPDTPGEPDCDVNGSNLNEPKLIPLDETSPTETKEVPSTNTTLPISLSTTTTPTPAVPSSLSSLSLENLSPEVAQILAQAKGNASTTTTTATANNPPITVNASISQSNPLLGTNSVLSSIPNLNITPNLLSTLLSLNRSNGIDSTNTPPANPIINSIPNLPLNFNMSSVNSFPLNQLLVQALALGLPPPSTFNNPIFPPPITSTININTNQTNNNPPPPSSTTTSAPTPSPRFSSPSIGPQGPRFHQNNSNHHPSHPRGGQRGRGFRRGGGGHNYSNRRDYYQNRNNNNNNPNTANNNNRNVFS